MRTIAVDITDRRKKIKKKKKKGSSISNSSSISTHCGSLLDLESGCAIIIYKIREGCRRKCLAYVSKLFLKGLKFLNSQKLKKQFRGRRKHISRHLELQIFHNLSFFKIKILILFKTLNNGMTIRETRL